MVVIPTPFTRLTEQGINAYDLAGTQVAGPPLDAATTFPVPRELEVEGYTVSPDLSRAVYAVADEAVCVDSSGGVLWRLPFGVEATLDGATCDCEFSADSRTVWIYRPDAGNSEGDSCDLLVAVNALTGTVINQVPLDTVGHGAVQFAHPDGVQMLLCISEPQDFVRLCRVGLSDEGIDVTMFDTVDRYLVDLAPNGERYMTVDVDRGNVAFHRWRDGALVACFGVAAFDHDPELAYLSSGGYLDADTAVISIAEPVPGDDQTFESDDDEDANERFSHYLFDLRDWRCRGTIDIGTDEPDYVAPLGDGTWLTSDDGGGLHRHR